MRPSAEPPMPMSTSIETCGSAAMSAPPMSPPLRSSTRAPALRTSAMSFRCRSRSRMKTTRSRMSLPLARATAARVQPGGASRASGPMASATERSTTSLSRYTAGPGRHMAPRGARAATESAPDLPSATRVAPSMALISTSSSGPSPVPTSAPVLRGDASPVRPSSSDTMRPRMGSRFRAAVMASWAAWSAATASPRPIQRLAARAPFSVTRTRPSPG